MAKQIVHLGTEVKVHLGVLTGGNVTQPVAIENGQQQPQSPVVFNLSRLDDAAFEELKQAIYGVRDQFASIFCPEGPAEAETPPAEVPAEAEAPVEEPGLDVTPLLNKPRRGR